MLCRQRRDRTSLISASSFKSLSKETGFLLSLHSLRMGKIRASRIIYHSKLLCPVYHLALCSSQLSPAGAGRRGLAVGTSGSRLCRRSRRVASSCRHAVCSLPYSCLPQAGRTGLLVFHHPSKQPSHSLQGS